MRALITGGSGHLATNLVNSLLEDGNWQITILDQQRPPEQIASHVHFIPVDVCSFQFDVRNIDVVFHLAAELRTARPLSQPRSLLKTNVLGTANVLSACYRCGVPNVVVTSSASVYGNNKAAAENSPYDPVNMYGASKVGQEVVCLPYRGTAVEVKILRIFNMWGPLMDDGVVCKFATREDALIVDPDMTRDYIHVSDVVQALKQAVEWDEGVYNVGSGVEVTTAGVWALVREDGLRYPEEPTTPLTAKDELQDMEILYSCADMTRTFDTTMWRPSILLHELSRKEILERL